MWNLVPGLCFNGLGLDSAMKSQSGTWEPNIESKPWPLAKAVTSLYSMWLILWGINKQLRSGLVQSFKDCVCPQTSIPSYLQGVAQWPLAPSESPACICWNKWKHCENRKSGQTPPLANSNSFPFWASRDQLSPNGQIDCKVFAGFTACK